MILRIFRFRVRKKKQRAVLEFMRREPLRLLRRTPGLRAAYFSCAQGQRREYLWVTLWTSEAARKRATQRKDWRELDRWEEAEFFAGKPEISHYQVLLRK